MPIKPMNKSSDALCQKKFFHPKYWLTWFGLACLWLWVKSPTRLQIGITFTITYLIKHTARRRYQITYTNIAQCWPKLDHNEVIFLTDQTLFDNIFGLIELGRTFWQPKKLGEYNFHFKNLHLLDKGLTTNRGILLIGAHYTTLDFGGLLFSQFAKVDILYRPHNNPLFDLFLLKARYNWAQNVYPREHMKTMIKAIKQGHILWFPADQDYGKENSVFAPFFNHPAATVTTPRRILKMTHAKLLVLGHYRAPGMKDYYLELMEVEQPNLEDDKTCATQINKAIEAMIRKHPTQYMWVHRRFKHQPEGGGDFYQ